MLPDESHPYAELDDILPKLAINLGWLRLMGDARIEQRHRQAPEANGAAIAKAKRRETRKRDRGLRGLALAILAA